jgi:hypothetical protein
VLPTPCAAVVCGLVDHILLVYTKEMVAPEKRVHRKRMGRPPGKSYVETFPVRLGMDQAKAIKAWAKQADVSVSEAIRRLVELGLRGAR